MYSITKEIFVFINYLSKLKKNDLNKRKTFLGSIERRLEETKIHKMNLK